MSGPSTEWNSHRPLRPDGRPTLTREAHGPETGWPHFFALTFGGFMNFS